MIFYKEIPYSVRDNQTFFVAYHDKVAWLVPIMASSLDAAPVYFGCRSKETRSTEQTTFGHIHMCPPRIVPLWHVSHFLLLLFLFLCKTWHVLIGFQNTRILSDFLHRKVASKSSNLLDGVLQAKFAQCSSSIVQVILMALQGWGRRTIWGLFRGWLSQPSMCNYGGGMLITACDEAGSWG